VGEIYIKCVTCIVGYYIICLAYFFSFTNCNPAKLMLLALFMGLLHFLVQIIGNSRLRVEWVGSIAVADYGDIFGRDCVVCGGGWLGVLHSFFGFKMWINYSRFSLDCFVLNRR
jgi:hypothetical protein